MPAPRQDLTRRRFGSLKVIEFDAVRHKAAYWLCECHCGQPACEGRISVKATRLLGGKTKHCAALGYRRDPERHKTARAKVPARKRLSIARKGGAANLAALTARMARIKSANPS